MRASQFRHTVHCGIKFLRKTTRLIEFYEFRSEAGDSLMLLLLACKFIRVFHICSLFSSVGSIC